MSTSWIFNKEVLGNHTMEYQAEVKINELLLHVLTWISQMGVILTERNQTQKGAFCIISSTQIPNTGKTNHVSG